MKIYAVLTEGPEEELIMTTTDKRKATIYAELLSAHVEELEDGEGRDFGNKGSFVFSYNIDKESLEESFPMRMEEKHTYNNVKGIDISQIDSKHEILFIVEVPMNTTRDFEVAYNMATTLIQSRITEIKRGREV